MDFKAVGREARRRGEPCAPARNPDVRDAIARGTGAAAIMEEFVAGWYDAEEDYTVEVRIEVRAISDAEALSKASGIASQTGGRVTAIFDKDWEEIQ
jgi:hypothetical protein